MLSTFTSLCSQSPEHSSSKKTEALYPLNNRSPFLSYQCLATTILLSVSINFRCLVQCTFLVIEASHSKVMHTSLHCFPPLFNYKATINTLGWAPQEKKTTGKGKRGYLRGRKHKRDRPAAPLPAKGLPSVLGPVSTTGRNSSMVELAPGTQAKGKKNWTGSHKATWVPPWLSHLPFSAFAAWPPSSAFGWQHRARPSSRCFPLTKSGEFMLITASYDNDMNI